MTDLTVTLIQADLAWEDKQANIKAFDKKIRSITDKSDLIILPEMFTTGFSMNADNLAETMDGPTVQWMSDTARMSDSNLVGSIIVSEKDHFFNRLIWVRPDGNLMTYDKRHLFRYADEHHTYHAGTRHLTISLNGWRIRPFICYDLRFPVWTRNSEKGYDLAIFVANWPQPRAAHWQTLLKARAIENQSFVVGVNRVGKDGIGHNYQGDSAVINPTGEVLFHAAHQEAIHTCRLSYQHLVNYRDGFPALTDAEQFTITLS